MTINELDQYAWLRKEIVIKDRHIRELDKELGGNLPPALKSQVKEYKLIIEQHQRKIVEQYKEIDAYIKGIEDPIVKECVTRKYVEHCTWEEIALDMEGYTVDGLKKRLARYLQKET